MRSELTAADLDRLPDDTKVWIDAMLERGARVSVISPSASSRKFSDLTTIKWRYLLKQEGERLTRGSMSWARFESWDLRQRLVPVRIKWTASNIAMRDMNQTFKKVYGALF